MKKYIVATIFALSFLPLLPATKQQDNFLKRQYKSLKSDLDLIKKCYGTTSPACTDNERTEVRKAALRVGGKAGGLVGAVLLISGLGGWWYLRFGKKDKDEEGETQATQIEERQRQLEALKKSIHQKTKFEIVDIQKDDNDVVNIIVGPDVEVTPFQWTPYESDVAELVHVIYPMARLITIKNPTKNQINLISISKQ